MYTLKVEKRNQETKAKKLRKMGMVTGNIRINKENTNILFMLPVSEAKKLIKKKSRGGLVEVDCDGQKYTALIREILIHSITGEIQEISLQSLEKGDVVITVARVVLNNRDKLSTLVTMELKEIPYKSLAEDIVETAEIDIAKYMPGEKISVSDFEICSNKNVEVLIDGKTIVASVTKTAIS